MAKEFLWSGIIFRDCQYLYLLITSNTSLLLYHFHRSLENDHVRKQVEMI